MAKHETRETFSKLGSYEKDSNRNTYSEMKEVKEKEKF